MKPSSSLALDSSVIIYHMRAADTAIAAQLKAASELYVPLTVLGEILYGIERSGNDPRATEQWRNFEQNAVLLRPDEATASAYATIKHHLKTKGKTIPDNDMWIAATAKSHQLPLFCRDYHFDELADVMDIVQVLPPKLPA